MNYLQNKIIERKNKYNKLRMQNIQQIAKNQLLNIQEESSDFNFQRFDLNFPLLKSKTKSKLTTFTKISDHCHRQIKSYERLNNKQILKDTLKKLLEKEVQSPNKQLKRIKKMECSSSSKNLQLGTQIQIPHPNQDSQKRMNIKKCSVLSMQRQNTLLNDKIYMPKQARTRKSLFYEQSQMIRRLIKRRIQEKSIYKQKINIISNTIVQHFDKVTVQQNEKNEYPIRKDENKLLKQRNPNRSSSLKLPSKQLIDTSKNKDKQNFKPSSSLSTQISIKNKNYDQYTNRKLINILF